MACKRGHNLDHLRYDGTVGVTFSFLLHLLFFLILLLLYLFLLLLLHFFLNITVI